MADTKRTFKSLLIVAAAAGAALIFAYFAGQNGQTAGDLSVFFICALVALVVNWVAYIPSALAKTEKFYDLVGAVTYLSLIITACLLSSDLDARAFLVAAMVVIWSVRLGSFLFKRIGKSGKDSRFDEIKVNPVRFLVAWTLQALWGIFTAAAAIAIISATERVPLGIFFWIGAIVWLIGFGVEVVADQQKSAFKSDPANEGDFIDTGLWAWSQHPNYFGEITLWAGISIIALPLLSGWSFLVLISPVFVYVLLTKLSGIPMLDKAAEKRWGDDPAYQRYRRETPVLVPRPPKS